MTLTHAKTPPIADTPQVRMAPGPALKAIAPFVRMVVAAVSTLRSAKH